MMREDELQRCMAEIQKAINLSAIERAKEAVERREEREEATRRNQAIERNILELQANMRKVLSRYEHSCLADSGGVDSDRGVRRNSGSGDQNVH